MTPEAQPEPRKAAHRLNEIQTRWSHLKGPPRDALDYLFRWYHRALLGYVGRRLARGDLSPLREADAEDLVQDFFVRLGTTDWLAKPDPEKGRFRPFLVRRLDFYLRERRATALGRPQTTELDGHADAVPDPSQDVIERWFDEEWELATADLCLDRLAERNGDWHKAVRAHIERDDAERDDDVAARLGWTVDRFRSHLKRGKSALRDYRDQAERRLHGESVEGEA